MIDAAKAPQDVLAIAHVHVALEIADKFGGDIPATLDNVDAAVEAIRNIDAYLRVN